MQQFKSLKSTMSMNIIRYIACVIMAWQRKGVKLFTDGQIMTRPYGLGRIHTVGLEIKMTKQFTRMVWNCRVNCYPILLLMKWIFPAPCPKIPNDGNSLFGRYSTHIWIYLNYWPICSNFVKTVYIRTFFIPICSFMEPINSQVTFILIFREVLISTHAVAFFHTYV